MTRIKKVKRIVNKYFKKYLVVNTKFILLAIFNFLSTNIILFALLSIEFLSTYLSTFIAILYNAIFGYFSYGKFAFNVKNIRNKKYLLKYIILLCCSWVIINSLIYIFSLFNITKNLAMIYIIIPISIFSYLIQKYFIFKSN
tara:strand:- start:57 stop:482 length:426 start_codon:yes stop_codon:yes gene_type:complete